MSRDTIEQIEAKSSAHLDGLRSKGLALVEGIDELLANDQRTQDENTTLSNSYTELNETRSSMALSAFTSVSTDVKNDLDTVSRTLYLGMLASYTNPERQPSPTLKHRIDIWWSGDERDWLTRYENFYPVVDGLGQSGNVSCVVPLLEWGFSKYIMVRDSGFMGLSRFDYESWETHALLENLHLNGTKYDRKIGAALRSIASEDPEAKSTVYQLWRNISRTFIMGGIDYRRIAENMVKASNALVFEGGDNKYLPDLLTSTQKMVELKAKAAGKSKSALMEHVYESALTGIAMSISNAADCFAIDHKTRDIAKYLKQCTMDMQGKIEDQTGFVRLLQDRYGEDRMPKSISTRLKRMFPNTIMQDVKNQFYALPICMLK